MAAAIGAVSTAGIGGAAAATLQADSVPAQKSFTADYQLANDSQQVLYPETDSAPQILTIAEHKPVDNLDEQLNKSIELAAERAAAEAEAIAAAEAEAAAAEAAAAEAELAAQAPSASVVKPAEGTFTSGFGMRWGSLHAGLDIANAVGTPILAAMGGTVIDSGPASGFGQWIRIQHDDGSIAVYGHMETLDVSVGEQVTAGQKIAGMGNRGFSTGSHLHFELYPTGSGAVDPAPWFAQHGITF
ncbi:M23 family metallopeptidase [Corynebacterium hylobatis]|uniref:M23 family metallopeptidase n=2 Tax=Corynebacterium TaxID=1716 RepID=A0A430HVD3_9CORY|nr:MULTISPECIES: M23 family metallopeptidase [Corynebacterium]MCS5480569.1 M23 family metallopeptidase [Corynebacterium lemuris]RSZ61306.1 M23 family metallopeptidase [Corynebacterium hylobatis]